MKFVHKGKTIEICGIDAENGAFTALQTWLSGERVLTSIEHVLSPDSNSNKIDLIPSQVKELHDLLDKFGDAFNPLVGLPPRRGRDHAINLLPRQGAVSVRPYRYPYTQKRRNPMTSR